MKGYKVFNPDWTCRGFKYEVGKTYEMPEEDIRICDSGYHFCEKVADCFGYYSFNPSNKVAEVEALGKIIKATDDSKRCTNKIHIVREISWEEMLTIANSGSGNAGVNNTGNKNSGNGNSGDFNLGKWNSGNRNSGNWNSGSRNSGNCNSGDFNLGNWNSGDWNATSFSSGCFNTEEQPFYMFNREAPGVSYMQWRNCYAASLLAQAELHKHLEWVCEDDMTAEDKKNYPEYTTTGGYLKIIESEDRQAWWDGIDEADKFAILSLPNFDAEIFKKCTGIDVTGEDE